MLHAFIGSFAAATACALLFEGGIAVSMLFLLIGSSILAYEKIIARIPFRNHIIPVLLFGISLGLMRVAVIPAPDQAFDPYLEMAAVATGMVVEEPDVRESHVRLMVGEVSLAGSGATTTSSSRILASVEHYPEFKYGDVIRIEGRLSVPEKFETGAGRAFDYPAYLAKDGIRYEMKFAKASLVSEEEGSWVKRKLFALKQAMISRIERVIPQPESSLLAGILFGVKQSLGTETLDEFKVAGIMHIIVLSGYNIAIIANSATKLFSKFGRYSGLASGAVFVILFVIMTGGGASVIRASLMALLVLFARSVGRMYAAIRALLLVGFAMILYNPLIILYDPGFQLSFLATLGLILVTPIVESKLRFVPEKWNFREIVVSTIATQIFVLPMLLYMTGSFSIVSFPVNILALPAVPVAMASGFVTGVIAFVSPLFALVPGVIAYALLSYILILADIAAKLPGAALSIPAFPFWLVCIAYAGYFVLIKRWYSQKETALSKKESTASFDVSGAYEIIN